MATGCASPPRHITFAPAPLPGTERAVLFSVDGSGNFQRTSQTLRQIAAESYLPLRVIPFEWSHGYGRILADQTDYCHACCQGKRLADQIVAVRQTCPDLPIYLLSYSAGSSVALAAAEHLPPETLAGLVLLSPSVSSTYDLRRALCSIDGHLDVFISHRDIWCLGLGTGIFGTADREWTAAAGRVGFEPVICTPTDTALYSKVREHSWNPCVSWTGNLGGHRGTRDHDFLVAYVMPLFALP
jgi:pimeloyl-ACP methyl ester carboxylesterase